MITVTFEVRISEGKEAEALAAELKHRPASMGVFDEGCMGMFNAIIPDHLLNPTGVFKERLSQSALYYETTQVSDAEARACFDWLRARGMTFHLGPVEEDDLTERQVLQQLKMYVAAVRIARQQPSAYLPACLNGE